MSYNLTTLQTISNKDILINNINFAVDINTTNHLLKNLDKRLLLF